MIWQSKLAARQIAKSALFCGTALSFFAGPSVWAQEAEANSGFEASEIVVTANKREQNIQDVGVAVSSIGSQALESVAKQDITAITRMVPSVQIVAIAATNSINVNIRGVSQNDFSPHQESPIAFYADGVYMANNAISSATTYDLERLEVLRGPQGTLFGRNATGGLVQVYSKRPTSKLEGYLTATVANFGTFIAEGAIGGPITDRLRARLSLQTKQGGGFYKNDIGRDPGDDHFYGGRLQVAADVGDTGELLLKVEHDRNENSVPGASFFRPSRPNAFGQGVRIGRNELAEFPRLDGTGTYTTCPGCDGLGQRDADGDPFTVSYPNLLSADRRITNLTANYTQDIGTIQLTSISSYIDLDKRSIIPSPNPFPTSLGISTTRYTQNYWQFSQELRLSHNEGPFRWTLGGYFLTYRNENHQIVDLTAIGAPIVQPVITADFTTKNRSYAVFGQAEYDLSDQFTVIGGLRYGWDNVKIDLVNSGGAVANPFIFNLSTYPNLARQKEGDWSGKFELDFKPTEDVLIYASVNRGTKSGGFNAPVFPNSDAPGTIPFGEEILTNYEGGFKLTFLDRRAHFNVTGFHYDYKNYQAFKPDGISFFIGNEQGKIDGVEADFDIRPLPGLLLSAYGTYVNARANVALAGNVDRRNRRLPNAPRWTFGGMAKYDIELNSGMLTLQGNVRWNDDQYLTVLNEPINFQKAYTIADAQISYAFKDMPFEITAFVNNLTNARYSVFNSDDTMVPASAFNGFLGNTETTYARPRYYGASFTVRW